MEEHEHLPVYPRESEEWLREHKDDSLSLNTKTVGKKRVHQPILPKKGLPRRAIIYSE